MEDEFEELQCLFQVSHTRTRLEYIYLTFIVQQLFDRDKDGVLNIREFQAIVKCLGLHLKIEKVIIIKN